MIGVHSTGRNGTGLLDSLFLGSVVIGDPLRNIHRSLEALEQSGLRSTTGAEVWQYDLYSGAS